MAFLADHSENNSTSDHESESDLPVFDVQKLVDEQKKVLFPKRRTSLEKFTKTRKQYSELIEIALFQLNEVRSGSSRQAIVKYILSNHNVGNNPERYIRQALVKLVEHNRIERKTGVGATGRFTLSKHVREAMRKGQKIASKQKKTKPKVSAKIDEKTAKTRVKANVKGMGNNLHCVNYSIT